MRAVRGIPSLAAAAVLLLPCAFQARADVIDYEEEIAFDRPEAWAMKYVTSAALLTGMGVPDKSKVGSIDAGFELGWLPHLSEDERRVGFNGTKVEDMNKLPALGRPRFWIGLPADLTLELSFVPPARIKGVKASLLTLALGRPLFHAAAFRFGGRTYAHFGKLEGDLTCPEDVASAGNDPVRNPFNCLEKSSDETTQRYYGFELSTAYETDGRFEPHAGVSVNYFDTEFQVDSTYGSFVDHSLLKTHGYTYAVTAGARFEASDRIGFAAELFYTPLSVRRRAGASSQNDELFNIRVLATLKLRKGR